MQFLVDLALPFVYFLLIISLNQLLYCVSLKRTTDYRIETSQTLTVLLQVHGALFFLYTDLFFMILSSLEDSAWRPFFSLFSNVVTQLKVLGARIIRCCHLVAESYNYIIHIDQSYLSCRNSVFSFLFM